MGGLLKLESSSCLLLSTGLRNPTRDLKGSKVLSRHTVCRGPVTDLSSGPSNHAPRPHCHRRVTWPPFPLYFFFSFTRGAPHQRFPYRASHSLSLSLEASPVPDASSPFSPTREGGGSSVARVSGSGSGGGRERRRRCRRRRGSASCGTSSACRTTRPPGSAARRTTTTSCSGTPSSSGASCPGIPAPSPSPSRAAGLAAAAAAGLGFWVGGTLDRPGVLHFGYFYVTSF
jgi:hypothetical protein